jgi:hypothetical protein
MTVVKYIDVSNNPTPQKVENKENIKYTPKIIIVCR